MKDNLAPSGATEINVLKSVGRNSGTTEPDHHVGREVFAVRGKRNAANKEGAT